MIDLRADTRAPRDRDELVDRLEQPLALAAHVRDVHAAVRRRRLAQRDELIGRCVRGGCVDERRPDTERAVAHRGVDERAHAPQLFGRGGPVVVGELVHADGRGADERRDVRRDAAPDERLQRLIERRPGDVVLDVALLLEPLLLHALVQRTERPALAKDLERHALAYVRLRSPIREERVRRPRQHVDEARRDGHPGGVELASTAGAHAADRRDAVALDGDVARARGRARAVIERAAADDDVVGGRHERRC